MLQLNATGKQWGTGVRKSGEILVTIGFGILIALVVLSGWLVESFKQSPKQRLPERLAQVEAKEKGLANVRKFFGQGVSAVRDFLVNNHPNAAELYAQDLRKAKAGVAAGITELRQSGSDQAVLKEFEKDLADYWSILDHARSFDARQKSENGYDYLREDVFPARNAAQDSIRELTDETSKERISLLAGYDQSRDSLLTWFHVVLGACVLFSILLTSASLSYRSNLRRESVMKFDEVARARDDLEHLSGKLLKVQEEERRRLSRELHDGIGQTLTALRMEIHQAHLSAGTGTAAAERLLRARMLAEEAVHTVKDISLLLRPPLLDDLGLEPAIAWQTDQFTRRTGIPCRFRAAGLQEMLPDDVKTCVFRVIQEALNNCQKHASPTKVQIVIEQKADSLSVQVEDDGAGFIGNEKNVRHSGLGILGMRERASMLGGSVSVQSSPGMGTLLTLWLPLARMSASGSPRLERPSEIPALGTSAEHAD